MNFKCQNCSQIALKLHWNRIETAKFRMIKLIVIISFLMIFINRESIIFRFALKPHWNGHIPLIISVEISQLLQTVSLWLRTAMKLLWNCSKTAEIKNYGTALILHWYCTEVALKFYWNCSAILLNFSLNCPENSMELPWKCTGTALSTMHCNFAESLLKLTWKCTEIALKMHWNCTGTALKLLWSCTGTALELH